MEALHTDTAVQVYGIILLLIGLAIRYWPNRNRFNRRNDHGIEGFRSYEHKNFLRFFESVLKLIAWPLILFGLFLILVGWFNKKSAEKHRLQREKTEAIKSK